MKNFVIYERRTRLQKRRKQFADGVNGTTNNADGTITGINDMAHDSGRASQGTEVNIFIS